MDAIDARRRLSFSVAVEERDGGSMRLSAICLLVAVSNPAIALDRPPTEWTAHGDSALVFIQDTPVLRAGSVELAEVDLATGLPTGRVVDVDKTMGGRLRTAIRDLQMRNEGLMVPKNISNYSVFEIPAGDYALVSYSGYVGVGTRIGCFDDAAPVFRIEAGVANVILAAHQPGDRRPVQSSGEAAMRDVERLLDEHTGLQAEARLVPLADVIAFDHPRGVGRVLTGPGCDYDQPFHSVRESAGESFFRP